MVASKRKSGRNIPDASVVQPRNPTTVLLQLKHLGEANSESQDRRLSPPANTTRYQKQCTVSLIPSQGSRVKIFSQLPPTCSPVQTLATCWWRT